MSNFCLVSESFFCRNKRLSINAIGMKAAVQVTRGSINVAPFTFKLKSSNLKVPIKKHDNLHEALQKFDNWACNNKSDDQPDYWELYLLE